MQASINIIYRKITERPLATGFIILSLSICVAPPMSYVSGNKHQRPVKKVTRKYNLGQLVLKGLRQGFHGKCQFYLTQTLVSSCCLVSNKITSLCNCQAYCQMSRLYRNDWSLAPQYRLPHLLNEKKTCLCLLSSVSSLSKSLVCAIVSSLACSRLSRRLSREIFICSPVKVSMRDRTANMEVRNLDFSPHNNRCLSPSLISSPPHFSLFLFLVRPLYYQLLHAH